MKTQLSRSIGALLIAGLFALPNVIQAQPTGHYVPGSEGLKAASLPPPGIWLRDYNWFYYSDRLNDPLGDKVPGDNKAYIYANVPRLLWITDLKPLGGYLGVDALVPLAYKDLKLPNGFNGDAFGVGDIFFEGTWSWHLKQFDLAVGAGVWAPTGDYEPQDPSHAGLGYWGEMLTAGATWYPDQEKKWSVSVLNRYEFNQLQRYSGVRPGEAYTVEGGVGYSVGKGIDVGAIGYYQQKVTGDSGPSSNHNRAAAVGPEISAFFPKPMLGLSLRYAYEFLADNRFQGHTFMLTLTKKF